MRPATELLTAAWSHYTSSFSTFVSIYLVPALLILAAPLIFGVETEIAELTPVMVPGFLVYTLVLFIVNILAGIALFKAASAPETGMKDAYSFATSLFFPYLWISLLVSVAVMVGFVLLIIPGIIFLVWFMFAHIVLIFEGVRGIGALKKSREYARGRWWALFGRILLLGIILMLISATFSIIGWVAGSATNEVVRSLISLIPSFITVPLSVIYLYLLYTDVRTPDAPENDLSNTEGEGPVMTEATEVSQQPTTQR